MSSDSSDSIGCAIWVFGIILLIVLFAGEPDLHDAIMHYLTNGNPESLSK